MSEITDFLHVINRYINNTYVIAKVVSFGENNNLVIT